MAASLEFATTHDLDVVCDACLHIAGMDVSRNDRNAGDNRFHPWRVRGRGNAPRGNFAVPVNRALIFRAAATGRYRAGPRSTRAIPRRLRGYVQTSGSLRSRTARGSPPEKKNWDAALTLVASSTFAVPTSGSTGLPLHGIAQGFDQNTRIGRKIYLKTLEILGNILFDPAAGAVGSDWAEMFLIWDKQANGGIPANTDIWTNSATPQTALRNLDKSPRFRVLKHEVFAFESAAGVSGAFEKVNRPFKWFVKCPLPITYNDPAGLYTSITINNLIIVFGSKNGLCSAAGYTRVRYTDP
nr:MAG: capsid protein [Cressdnaviricota sp.]